MSDIGEPEEWRVLADAVLAWKSTEEHYDANPSEMWGQGGGLVNAYTGEPVPLDLRKWDAEQLLVQFAYLEHSVYTYDHSPLVTPQTRWDIGKPGTWFRFRFENKWKLSQVKKEILRRMEYLDYLTKTKKKNLGGMK